MTSIHEEYAKSIFSLAMESNQLNEFQAGFLAFTEAIDEKTMQFFNHPKISKNEKKQVIEHSVKLTLLKHFLFVLIDNERMNVIPSIFYSFSELIDDLNKIKKVQVYSKKVLSDDQRKALLVQLEKDTYHKIELEEIIDDSIISGFRLEYDGLVKDETSNRQLEDLKSNLKRG
ncbi:MAG: ATP synthase F1 subunit delta [Firmicutes bacterium]|nr:ATP synthase F1 subunit delta [Bacillota bacterium]